MKHKSEMSILQTGCCSCEVCKHGCFMKRDVSFRSLFLFFFAILSEEGIIGDDADSSCYPRYVWAPETTVGDFRALQERETASIKTMD